MSDGQKWNLQLLTCYSPPAVTWTELLRLPLPDAGDSVDTEVVDNKEEQEVGGEGHHYPTRDKQLPDRYTPVDLRQKKT